MTTQDIIKILPLEENEKQQMLNLYERGTKEQKIEIDVLAWTNYLEMYDETIDENFAEEVDQIKKGKGGPLDGLYPRVVEKAEKELNEETNKAITAADLTMARKAMKQIVDEIHAAKQDKKASSQQE